ncbi:MAG: tetratricopeptide repeat protein [Anaerolineae bacterium]
MQRGEFEAAAALLDQGLRRFRSMGRTHMVTVSLINLGFCRLEMGEPGESALLAEEALGTARASGDQHREASATFLAGEAALELGDPPAAVARFDTALALSRTIGDVDGQVHALALLGSTAMLMGRRSELAVHVRDALALLADAFDPLTACSVLELAASCAGDEANLARGMRLVGAAEAERGRVGALRTVTEERLHARFMSLATNVFGSSAVKMALAEGRRLPLAEALAVAHQITRAALEGPPASDTPADCGGRSPAALQGAR